MQSVLIAVAAVWALSLWWLIGAALLHCSGRLPATPAAQWRAGLLWPLRLLVPYAAPRSPTARWRSLLLIALGVGSLAILSGPAGAAAAQPTQPLETLVNAARQFLVEKLPAAARQTTEVSVDAPDPRLKLARCAAPLAVAFPPGAAASGRTTVAVRCPGSPPWRVHLRAELSRRVAATVWARNLPRGHLVTADDLQQRTLAVDRLPRDAISAPAQAIGATVRQPVRRETLVRAHLLDRLPAVGRGERVTLTYAAKRFRVTAVAIALDDGHPGDRIRIRSLSSQQELDAVVIGRGEVEAL